MAVDIVEPTLDCIPRICEFFARVYRPDYVLALQRELLEWQFSGPRGESRPATLNLKAAIVDGEVAACLGYVPVEFSWGEKACRGAWTANWVTAPRFRSLGLGPLLMRALTSEFDVTAAVGISDEARSILPRMGFTDLGTLTRYLCVLDARQVASLTLEPAIDWPISAPSPCSHDTHEVTTVDAFGPEATTLWNSTRDGDCGTARSHEFLNWRYARHPVWDYRLLTYRKQGRLHGIAIYRVEQVRDMPVRVGRLVELLGDDRDVDPLLQAVAADARSRDVAAIDFFCRSDRLHSGLCRNGFMTSNDAPIDRVPVLLQPVARDRAAIRFMVCSSRPVREFPAGRWYVTKGDGDQDRPN
jgi:hypothetical protein